MLRKGTITPSSQFCTDIKNAVRELRFLQTRLMLQAELDFDDGHSGYSSKILNERINKQNQYKRLLAKLAIKQHHYDDMLFLNSIRYEKAVERFKKIRAIFYAQQEKDYQAARIEADKKYNADLKIHKENLKKFREAENALKNLNAELISDLKKTKKPDEASLKKSYTLKLAKWQTTYFDVADVNPKNTDPLGCYLSCINKFPKPNKPLIKKPEAKPNFDNIIPTFELLDPKAHASLVKEAHSLLMDFEKTSDLLISESKTMYATIHEKEVMFLDSLIDHADMILKKHKDLYTYFYKNIKPEYIPKPGSLLPFVKQYQIFENAKESISEKFNDDKIRCQIKQLYETAHQKFGIDKTASIKEFLDKKDRLCFVIENKLKKECTVFGDLKIKETLPLFKRTIDIAKLIELLRCAIENNLTFWNEQLYFNFGNLPINKTPVPTGIANIHKNILHPDSKVTLKKMKNYQLIIKERLDKWFSTRTSVTHKFYRLFANINLDDFNLVEITKELNDITGSRLNLTPKPEYTETPTLPPDFKI